MVAVFLLVLCSLCVLLSDLWALVGCLIVHGKCAARIQDRTANRVLPNSPAVNHEIIEKNRQTWVVCYNFAGTRHDSTYRHADVWCWRVVLTCGADVWWWWTILCILCRIMPEIRILLIQNIYWIFRIFSIIVFIWLHSFTLTIWRTISGASCWQNICLENRMSITHVIFHKSKQ